MRLTFRGWLLSYCQELTGLKTTSVKKLVSAVEGSAPHASAAVFLPGRGDWEGCRPDKPHIRSRTAGGMGVRVGDAAREPHGRGGVRPRELRRPPGSLPQGDRRLRRRRRGTRERRACEGAHGREDRRCPREGRENPLPPMQRPKTQRGQRVRVARRRPLEGEPSHRPPRMALRRIAIAFLSQVDPVIPVAKAYFVLAVFASEHALGDNGDGGCRHIRMATTSSVTTGTDIRCPRGSRCPDGRERRRRLPSGGAQGGTSSPSTLFQ